MLLIKLFDTNWTSQSYNEESSTYSSYNLGIVKTGVIFVVKHIIDSVKNVEFYLVAKPHNEWSTCSQWYSDHTINEEDISWVGHCELVKEFS